jgi:hypothetical protein
MWSILLAVFRFPLGLIALPYKEESQVVILRAARQRHAMQLSGAAYRWIRAARELATN